MTDVSFRRFTGSGAESYERYFVPAIAAPVAAGLLAAADLQPGERVLDVACGTGIAARLAAPLVGATGTVTGVDVAPEMIDVAGTIAPDLEWHVGDAAALPLPDGAYDVVLCQLGLMFMDRAAALAEMRRVLAPGGRVVVATPGAIQPFFEQLEQAIVEHIAPELGGFVRAVFSLPDPDAVADLLRDAGLGDVEGRLTTATFALPAPVDFLWQYINLTPMGPFVAAAPQEAQDAMERTFAERAAGFVVDGRTPLEQPMVLATGFAS